MSKRFILSFVVSLLFAAEIVAQNSLDFDGTNDYVQTSLPAISGTNARTIEAWIKTTKNTIPPNGTQQVIADMGSFVTGGRFTFCMVWNNAIRIEIGGNGLSGTTAINDGVWHHVAVVYNNALSSNKYKLYVDGTLEAQGNLTVAQNTAAGNLKIGLRMDGINPFDGQIDELRVWNTARTASQINNYKDSVFCTPPNGLIADYDFNVGVAGGSNAGQTTLPNSVGAQDGVLQNFALAGNGSNWVNGVGMYGGSTDSSFSVSECYSYLSPSGKYIWDSTGVYYDTISNSIGCDSILSIDLSIVDVDVSTSQAGVVLSANNLDASSYQWIDCSDLTPILGANSVSYTAVNNGEYAVVVAQDGCTDTSDCLTVTGIGIMESEFTNVRIYPNPVQSILKVEWNQNAKPWNLLIFDLRGQIAIEVNGIDSENFELDARALPAGIYIVELDNNAEKKKLRLIVQ